MKKVPILFKYLAILLFLAGSAYAAPSATDGVIETVITNNNSPSVTIALTNGGSTTLQITLKQSDISLANVKISPDSTCIHTNKLTANESCNYILSLAPGHETTENDGLVQFRVKVDNHVASPFPFIVEERGSSLYVMHAIEVGKLKTAT